MRYILSVILALCCMVTSMAQTVGYSLDKALGKLRSGDFEECRTELQALERTTRAADVYYVIGECYRYGYIFPKDSQKAFSYYRKSAEKGLPVAQKALAECYSSGIGVTANKDRAVYWEKKAAGRYKESSLSLVTKLYNEGLQNQSAKTTELAVVPDTTTSPQDVSIAVAAANTPNPAVSVSQPQPKVSHIDQDLPIATATNNNIYAVVVANENYQDLASVSYALADGKSIKAYLTTTFGIPEVNIHFVTDATLSNIKREINWLEKVSQVADEDSRLIFYYAGHGFPDEKTRDPYLVPVDGFTDDITTCLPLNELYSRLGSMRWKECLVLLDACFSGHQRGDKMLAQARGIAIKPKAESASIPQNMVVMTSSSGDEASYPLHEQGHGLFTYSLLNSIKQQGGKVSLGELYESVSREVTRTSVVVNNKSQTPQVLTSIPAEQWRNITF